MPVAAENFARQLTMTEPVTVGSVEIGWLVLPRLNRRA